ncbi:MAG: hypothetical protein JW934_06840 [Anaerolineae bacterium]|nr:hypothetical protein [Anaerolineae bacterium]
MSKLLPKCLVRFQLWWIVVTVAVIYLAAECLWKMLFLRGTVFGVYWLFVIVDKTILPVAVAFIVTALIVLLVGAVRSLAHKPGMRQFMLNASILFVSGVLFLSTWPILFAQNTVHLDCAQVAGRTYYLTAYPMFDVNYALYECDSWGVFCTRVYRSGDILAGGLNVKLVYRPDTGELAIQDSELAIIYAHQVR